MKSALAIVSGSASEKLAKAIARQLRTKVAACRVRRFPDTEVRIELDESVRERRVFIVASSCPPVDERIMEALAIADACRRAAARSITWIAPYFGYARSDKRQNTRTPIMGRLVADFAERAGIDQVIAVDLHSQQVEGFFHVPLQNLSAVPAIADALKSFLDSQTVIVSPDAGRVKMASAYGSLLGRPVAVLHKERANGRKTAVSKIVGEVRAKPCLIIDDMISTGGTTRNAIDALLRAGAAESFFVAASHGVFTPEARNNLNHPAIRKIIVTDSIPIPLNDWSQVKTVSLAPILAEAMRRSIGKDR